MKAIDLFKQSYRLARVTLKAGRVPSTDQTNEALTAANSMLGRWSANPLNAYQMVIETFSLVAATKSYTMGPDGTWDTVRPQRIERANLITSTDQRAEIEVVDFQSWADVPSQNTSGQPDILYNDRATPLSTLYFNDSPNANYSVELYSWKPFTRFQAATTDVEFPPEYEETIVYNLALRLAALNGTQVDPEVREIARTSLADLESLNAPSPVMECDGALLSSGGGDWDYRTNR